MSVIIPAEIISVGFKPLVLHLMETPGQILSWYKGYSTTKVV